LYPDRSWVPFAEPYIKQSLGLTNFQVGLFFSVFFLTYALAQVPAGWLSDRFGARRTLTIYILVWSFFTAMIGLSGGFLVLLLMRAGCGLGQAGAYPTSASILSKWVPFSNRGLASSIVAFGGRLGGAIAPILTAVLIFACVPVSQSSRLVPSDLLDGSVLCSRLVPVESLDATAADRTAIDHVWNQFDPALQRRIQNQIVTDAFRQSFVRRRELEAEARRCQQQFRFLAAWRTSQQAISIVQGLSDADSERLLGQLNQMVDSADFYQRGVFDGLNLDRAAVAFIKRVEANGELSGTEQQRFHRLLLEAIFPNALGRIYVSGWRPVMFVYGALGLLVSAWFWRSVRNRPEEHPRCNAAESALISAGRPPGAPSPHGRPGNIPWNRLLSSVSMWLNCFAQVGTNIGWVFLVTWFPKYLLEEHSVPILQRGLMASTPLFVGWLGMFSGGRLTDISARHLGLKWGRRLPWSCSRFVAMGAFLCCPFLDSPWGITMALSVVAFATDLGTASGWSYCQDVGGRYVGSILGWGNMWGNLGATVSPILLAWVFENHGWSNMFLVCAVAFGLAGTAVMGIDASRPIAPDEPA
ncbi:MAG: MFS transporter, partial [Pirellulaceae bacterium]